MRLELIVLLVGLLVLAACLVIALAGHRSFLRRRDRNHSERRRKPAPALLTPGHQGAPQGLRPAMVGALRDGSLHDADLLVNLVDLAARGYLTLNPLRDQPGDKPYDWAIRRTSKPSDDLTGFEKTLVDQPFGDAAQTTITLSGLTSRHDDLLAVARRQLERELHQCGWLAEDERAHSPWGWIGAIVLVLGLLTSVAMIITWLTHDDLRGVAGGLAIVAGGILLASVGRTKPHSEVADQLLEQLGDYEDFLRTGLAAQLDPARLGEQFSLHLAWAMQLRVLLEFSTAFDSLIARSASWGQRFQLVLPWLRCDDEADRSATQLAQALVGFAAAARDPRPATVS